MLKVFDGSPDLWTWQRLWRHTSGTVSPVQPMLNDAAGVSHAPAPVLHREGFLAGPLPTDDVVQASTWQPRSFRCAMGFSCRNRPWNRVPAVCHIAHSFLDLPAGTHLCAAMCWRCCSCCSGTKTCVQGICIYLLISWTHMV